MADDAIISAKIRALREEKGVSEMDMANAVGTPLTLYRVFETSPSKFAETMLEKAANVLGVEVSDLGGE